MLFAKSLIPNGFCRREVEAQGSHSQPAPPSRPESYGQAKPNSGADLGNQESKLNGLRISVLQAKRLSGEDSSTSLPGLSSGVTTVPGEVEVATKASSG
ncbi:D(2) Dopamine Receptor [Manis pentadactyla]|nr:D(2) Dopamine Receptor [Manis pentadactyla]